MKTVQEYTSEAKDFIDTGQFLELISGVIPDDPWSEQSLNECEKGFLKQYKENPEKDYSHYILFIGEGLRRIFNGAWETGAVMDSEIEEMSEVIGIYYPNKHFDVLSSILDTSLAYGNALTWSTLFMTTKHLLKNES